MLGTCLIDLAVDPLGLEALYSVSLMNGSNTLSRKYFIQNRKNFKIFRFWLGGAAPQTPQILAGGAKPLQTPRLNSRSSHLIEAAKRGRLDQMIFFSAPLTTRAPPGRPAGRPAECPAGHPLTTRAPPIEKKKCFFFFLGPGSQARVPINVIYGKSPTTTATTTMPR